MVTTLKWSQPSNSYHPRMVTTLEWLPPSSGHHPRMVTTLEWLPPLNSYSPRIVTNLKYCSHIIGSSEQNKCPWPVALASKHGTHTQLRIISDDRYQASAVRVVWLVSMADSRTERLCVLLTASNSSHCIARIYIPYWAVIDVCGISKEINATLE